MTTLRDFKTTMLGPLFQGEAIDANTPLFLFAARLDDPLQYVFESDRWDEVAGAAKRLAAAGGKLRLILAEDGFTADDLLHADDSGVLALTPDRGMAERWIEAMERAVAAETDLVTVSSVILPITARQLTEGLYGIPRAVLGVPGVHDYQERVNRYYGLSSPSTVPREDAVLQRRHFGEVVALIHSLLVRARESRVVVPFFESLPFAERCASCRIRPAESTKGGDEEGEVPICGVCLRKRMASPGTKLSRAGLIWIEAANLDRALEHQRTPASHRRLYQDIEETLHIAIPGRRSVTVLAAGGGRMALAAPASDTLEVATEMLEAISLHYGLKLPTAFIAAVVLGEFAHLYDLLQQTASHLRRAVDGTTCLLDVRTLSPDGAFDRFRKPYTIDEARRLLVGMSILRDAVLPDDFLAEMPEQVVRGSAGLYYVFERSKLAEAGQQVLKRLEHAWDAGAAPGPRYYTMLADALALARRVE